MTASGKPVEWYEHTTRVRYAETDQMGVVYHGNYLVYMEEGRTLMMESLGLPYAELELHSFPHQREGVRVFACFRGVKPSV